MSDTFWFAVAGLAAGVTAFVPPILWAVRKGWKAFKRLVLFLDDYEGTPARPGVDARPGVMERLKSIEANQKTLSDDRVDVKNALGAAESESARTREEVKAALVAQEKRTAAILADLDVRLGGVEEQVAVVHHEVQPNGGSSIKDQINRLDPEFPPEEASP
ncbi:MAG TPA: hypothetical protein VGH54_10230 [Mycobacterium sp.]|jgi:hypothetical protein|uniref:hypothetical protein n=1 Tax=Mycobacterium sp. TaxID=1785 RepID=UPI002F3EF916